MSNASEVKQKSFKKSGIVFLILVAIMLGVVFKNVSPRDIAQSMKKLDPVYFGLGMGLMGLYCIGDAVNIRRPLRTLGYPVKRLQAIKYAILGFFFSYITPSATGGQPVQIYYMFYDDIKISHSTLTLLIQLIGHETAITIYAILGFVTQYDTLNQAMGHAKFILLIGILINFALDAFLLSVVFFKRTADMIHHAILSVARKISDKAAGKVDQTLSGIVSDYEHSAAFLTHHYSVIFRSILTALLQMLAMFSVPYMVYRGFGYSDYNWFQIVMLQAVLFVAVGFIPLPGAVGVSEGLFFVIFSVLFPAHVLTSAMLIDRCINLYFCLAIDGLFVLRFTHQLIQNRVGANK